MIDKIKILDMGVIELLNGYKNGEFKPSQVVEIYIEHQIKTNSILNFVVETRYEEVLKEAKKSDLIYLKGENIRPLEGVPFSMKESFDVENMHSTGGVTYYRDNIVSKDAAAVKELKENGALILCKTNTPTLCFCQESHNNLFGRTNNPWNIDHTTGGSSGGEGVAVAIGACAAGFGSDIGGSIRFPAHFNGVVGFKAASFSFPEEGHFPPLGSSSNEKKSMLGYGPLSKSVKDAALVYSTVYPQFSFPKDWSLPGDLKIISVGSFGKTICDSDTQSLFETCEKTFDLKDVSSLKIVPPFMEDVSLAWQLFMSEDGGAAIREIAYPNSPTGHIIDWLRYSMGLNTVNHNYLSWALIGARLFKPSSSKYRWAKEFIQKGQEWLSENLGNNGVILSPVYPSPAKKHGEVYDDIFNISKSFRWNLPYVAMGNLFGMATLVVPCGFSHDGLPIAMQLAAPAGSEEILFRTGKHLESVMGGYVRNKMHDNHTD
jgi:Asp-tRNA(Asn)/Glu-tRNA(Gln) amidotransferase A subunit family amidase